MKSLGYAIVLFLGCFFIVGYQPKDWGPDHNGRIVSQQELNGRWVILSYWAEWCEPCRREVHELNRLYENTSRESLQIFGVNFDGRQGESLRAAVQDLGMRYPTLQNDPSKQLNLILAHALPVTVIVNAKGNVCLQLLGEQTKNNLQEHIRALENGSALGC